jgi:hypothetical protein
MKLVNTFRMYRALTLVGPRWAHWTIVIDADPMGTASTWGTHGWVHFERAPRVPAGYIVIATCGGILNVTGGSWLVIIRVHCECLITVFTPCYMLDIENT